MCLFSEDRSSCQGGVWGEKCSWLFISRHLWSFWPKFTNHIKSRSHEWPPCMVYTDNFWGLPIPLTSIHNRSIWIVLFDFSVTFNPIDSERRIYADRRQHKQLQGHWQFSDCDHHNVTIRTTRKDNSDRCSNSGGMHRYTTQALLKSQNSIPSLIFALGTVKQVHRYSCTLASKT